MNEILVHMGLYGVVFLMLFGIAEYLFHKQNVKTERTRKLVHFGAGALSLTFPFLFEEAWPVLLLCGSFFGILLLSKKFGFLNSINGVARKTYGAILFPLVVSGCFLVQSITGDMMTYFLPILILSISDPVAALVGKRFPWGKFTIAGHGKTIAGSLGFMLTASLITVFLMSNFLTALAFVSIQDCFLIAGMAMIAEAVSKNGYDNFTIPASVTITLMLLQNPIIC